MDHPPSATLEGVGTLLYQGVVHVDISSLSKASIRKLAVMFRPEPEIATSLAELLSTKQSNDMAEINSRHAEKATTSAESHPFSIGANQNTT